MAQQNFDKQQIRDTLQKRRDWIIDSIQNRLLRAGENFVTNARNNGTYKDHTGNLRSSIGYVLFKNGVQVNENFKVFPSVAAELGAKVGIGPEQARMIIDDIISKYPTGLVLVCVAGMSYAAAVESKGFDVITSSALIAKNELETGLEDLRQKISKR